MVLIGMKQNNYLEGDNYAWNSRSRNSKKHIEKANIALVGVPSFERIKGTLGLKVAKNARNSKEFPSIIIIFFI